MTEPTPPHFYQAIGTVYGILDFKPPSSTLTVGQHSFPVTVKNGVEKRHLPGKVECFRFYPKLRAGLISLHIIAVVLDAPQEKVGGELTLKGCWELYQEQPYFIIYRNDLRGIGDKQTKSLVPVMWENAPPPDGQFWEVVAEIRDGAFVVSVAEGAFEPPPKATGFVPPKSVPKALRTPQGTSTKLTASVPPLSIEEIREMAIPAKVQLACKINQLPPARTLSDGRSEFFLNDGERILTVRMKQKNFKKLKEHGFTSWVATISGTLGEVTETGFELANASVQVFEKKEKEAEAKPEETKEVAVSSSDAAVARQQKAAPSASEAQKKNAIEKKQQPQVQDDSPVAKRKRLLQGIDLR